MQKCQVGLERLRDVHSKVIELEAEKRNLEVALGAKDQQLQEEVRRNVILVADLETAEAEINKLKAEMEVQEKLAVDLVETLEKHIAESKSALEKQKVELEEKLQAEAEVAYLEGAHEVTTSYEAQVLEIS